MHGLSVRCARGAALLCARPLPGRLHVRREQILPEDDAHRGVAMIKSWRGGLVIDER